MTIIDFRKHWNARRRAECQKSGAQQEGDMEEVRRSLDAWTPLIEELIEAEKAHARLPRCEGPRCPERTANVHPIQGQPPGGASIPIRLCDMHLDAVRCGCLRLTAGDETDALVWEWDVPEGVPREQIRVRRRRGSRRSARMQERPSEEGR